MATPVHVWPLHLLGGVYADLHGGNVITHGFNRMLTTLTDEGVTAEQITYQFDFETPIVQHGSIVLSATGGSYPGVAEAESSAVATMVDAVRTHYNIFPADYNFVRVSENRRLFNEMRSVVHNCRRIYAEMELTVNNSHTALLKMCKDLSYLIGHRTNNSQSSDIIAASAFQATMSDKAEMVGSSILHASSIIDMLTRKDREPNEQRRFDRTVPMPQIVSWERSYYTLRTVFDQAVKKLPGPVSPFRLVLLDDGQLKASIYLPAAPFTFSGPPGATKEAAKAKLCYEVIKYVNNELGIPIMDLNFTVRRHQDSCIGRFDRKMKGIRHCGDKLKCLLDETGDLLAACRAELTPRMEDSAFANAVYQCIAVFTSKLSHAKTSFNEAMSRLEEAQDNA